MPNVNETQARLWDAGKQVPEVPCPTCAGWGQGFTRTCPTCNGSRTVPSDLAKTCEMATTVLCSARWVAGRGVSDDASTLWHPTIGHVHPAPHPQSCRCNGTGRVLRPTPGEVPCACTCHDVLVKAQDVHKTARCERCGIWQPLVPGTTRPKRGTVPGTDEASVVARLEACGLLWPVLHVLAEVYESEEMDGQLATALVEDLAEALHKSDLPGAFEAATKAVEAVVAQGVRA